MGKIVGIDTSLFIYLLEEHTLYLKKATRLFNSIQSGDLHGVFSSVGLIKILTGPKKHRQFELAAHYKELVAGFPNISIIGINENIVELASDLRARYGIKTPDAIHIATALDQNADSFVTNDKKLKKVREVRIKCL